MVMLAKKYKDQDPTGWFMSEKLDGIRATWDGVNLISRSGKIFNAPKWFIAQLPNIKLDGELFIGNGRFQETVSKVMSKNGEWKSVKFIIFDVINEFEFHHRVEYLATIKLPIHCSILTQSICKSLHHMRDFEHKVLKNGGEGVIIKNPNSFYQHKRSNDVLKVKKFDSSEAVVTGYIAGMGKHLGKMGVLICQWNGKKLKLVQDFPIMSERTLRPLEK